MRTLPRSIGSRITPPGVRDMVTFRQQIRTQIDAILARKPSPDETPSIFTHLRDDTQLPASEKSAQRLEDEATLITMAGTYSPMLSLIVAHYHLVTRPDIMTKLRSELAANPAALTATQFETLPYLSAIGEEALRLTFGLTGRNPRVCPDETLVYSSPTPASGKQSFIRVPPGTAISASTLLVHTDESLFPDPWNFNPERWTEEANEPVILARRRRANLSFMRGPRTCIGLHLANAELAVAVAAMAQWDMKLYETTEEDVAFKHDYHVMCPRLGSSGVRVEVIGRARG